MKTKSLCMCALALALTTATLTGCGGGDTAPAPSVGKQTVELYPVSGILKETDGFAMPGTITLSATNKDGIVNLYSDKSGGNVVTSVTVGDDGICNFYVDKNAALPVTIMAYGSTSVPNHIDSSTKFDVTAAGTTYFAINIIDYDFPSAGVDVDVVPANNVPVSGALPALINLNNNTKNLLLPLTINVTIAPSTVLTDASGNKLTGKVQASLTAFASSTTTGPVIDPAVFSVDPESEVTAQAVVKQSDLENFPGGLNNKNAGAGAGYFETAGFVAVNVTDDSGKKAKNVASGTFTIRFNIPAGTVDPNSGAVIKKGDSIPLYTYDEATMLWVPEHVGANTAVTGTVDQDPVTNELFVLHTTDHFSFWNLGWAVTTPGKFCASATINLQNDLIAYPFNLKATISKGTKVTGNNTLLTGFKPANDKTITVQNVPNVPLDIVFTDALNNVIYCKSGYNLCSKPNLIATYTAPVAKKAVPVTVTVTEYCTNDPTGKAVQVVPSTSTQVALGGKNPTKGGIPAFAYTPISYGVTNASGVFVHNLAPVTADPVTGAGYVFTAFDRRTNKYYPDIAATVKVTPVSVFAKTPLAVSIKIPVTTCKPPVSGSTGGYTFF